MIWLQSSQTEVSSLIGWCFFIRFSNKSLVVLSGDVLPGWVQDEEDEEVDDKVRNLHDPVDPSETGLANTWDPCDNNEGHWDTNDECWMPGPVEPLPHDLGHFSLGGGEISLKEVGVVSADGKGFDGVVV